MREQYSDGLGYVALQYVLEKSRDEPPIRRLHIICDSDQFTRIDQMNEEISSLADDYMDLIQKCHKHLNDLFESHKEVAVRHSSLKFLHEKLQDCPLQHLIQILDESINYIGFKFTPEHQKEWDNYEECKLAVESFEFRFDQFIARLRSRYYIISNAEARHNDPHDPLYQKPEPESEPEAEAQPELQPA